MKTGLENSEKFILVIISLFILLIVSTTGLVAYTEINKQNNCFELLKHSGAETSSGKDQKTLIEKFCR